jgi:hypothetical protein
MALIIEDGTGKDDAQSYVTAAEARAFAALRGITLDATDGPVEILLMRAMDYLEALDYIGTRSQADQALSWPRADADPTGDGALPADQVPQRVKNAQMQLAVEAQGQDLMPSGDGRQVLKEKVDVIETQYAEGSTSVATPVFPKVDAYLRGLIDNASSIGKLRTVRI